MPRDVNRVGLWGDLPFFANDWATINAALQAEKRLVLPPDQHRFVALELTPPDDVRVVILGQDPYPTPGHANGLAFSVTADTKPLPRSLNNIFSELQTDLGACPVNGDLAFWARQGVLLLNTALSVAEGSAGAHAKLGWRTLTEQILDRVSRRPTAFVLWGKAAQSIGGRIHPGNHLIVKSAHPSPLSAYRGFFGSKPFSRINTWLSAQGKTPINWTGSTV